MKPTKENIILIGGGGHCKSIIDVIELEDKFNIAGIIDDNKEIGFNLLGYKVIGDGNNLEALFNKYKNAIISIGQIKTNESRVRFFNILKEIGYNLPVIISPLAYVSKHSTIQEGTVVMHHALINSNAKIGKNCIINTKALIEHDVTIEDNCHISTSAVINGGVTIKKNTFFGSNATSKEYIAIDKFVRAGTVQI